MRGDSPHGSNKQHNKKEIKYVGKFDSNAKDFFEDRKEGLRMTAQLVWCLLCKSLIPTTHVMKKPSIVS